MVEDASFLEKCRKAYFDGVSACRSAKGDASKVDNPYLGASLREQWTRGWNSVVGDYKKAGA